MAKDSELKNAVEGGELVDQPQREPHFDSDKHRAETAARIAYLLVIILAGTLVLHFVGTLYAAHSGLDALDKSLGELFKVWIPVIASLTGSAVSFYFARSR